MKPFSSREVFYLFFFLFWLSMSNHIAFGYVESDQRTSHLHTHTHTHTDTHTHTHTHTHIHTHTHTHTHIYPDQANIHLFLLFTGISFKSISGGKQQSTSSFGEGHRTGAVSRPAPNMHEVDFMWVCPRRSTEILLFGMKNGNESSVALSRQSGHNFHDFQLVA